MSLFLVALAGAVGAPARYVLDILVTRWVERRFTIAPFEGSFPWGITIVNFSGSFLLGVIAGLFELHKISALAKLSLGTGFCGAYTTFSTFALQTIRLGRARAWLKALANSVIGVGVGLALAAAGLEATLRAFG